MRIKNVKATQMDLTPAISDYVEKRVNMIDKVIDPNDTSASVFVEVGKTTQHHKEGDFFFAEMNVHIAGRDFRAMVEKDDLYAAIDEVKDEVIREIVGYKNRRRTMVRRGGAAIKNILKGIGGKINPFRRFRK